MKNSTTRKSKMTNRSITQMAGPTPGSSAKEIENSDSEVTGLRVAVSSSGRKFFRFRYTINGQKRVAKIGEFPAIDVQEARRLALEMRAAIDRGIDPQEQRDLIKQMPTFAEFALKEYLPYATQQKAASSVASDSSKLRIHLLERFGERRLCDITTRDVQLHVGAIKASHCEATANRHLALVSKIYNVAILWGRVDRNPCKGIQKFREAMTHTKCLSPDDIQKLLKAMESEPNIQAVAALKLLLLTGVRREEALQALWTDVDLPQARWFLPKTKNGKTHHVVLNDEAVDLLRHHPRIAGSPFVFPGRDATKPLCNPRKAFTRILNAAGLPHMRIHDLRHAYASLAVQSGASLYQVQCLLNHASPQTTQRYAHMADDALRQASASVSNVITRARAGNQSLSEAT